MEETKIKIIIGKINIFLKLIFMKKIKYEKKVFLQNEVRFEL